MNYSEPNKICGSGYAGLATPSEVPKASDVMIQFEFMDKCIARLSEAVKMIDRRTECVRLPSPECEAKGNSRQEVCGSTIEQYIADRYAAIDALSDRLQTILRELRV